MPHLQYAPNSTARGWSAANCMRSAPLRRPSSWRSRRRSTGGR